jgi:glycosyltransferase involved in cell wall biosynthesis
MSSDINIGWIGRSEAHYHNLKILIPVFQKLSITHKFSFICAGVSDEVILKNFFSLDNNNINVVLIKKEEVDWTDEKQIVDLIRKFDIGLMPLVFDDSTKGKCAFKAIQYIALGIPVVASPVGEINYLINDGINGFTANSCDEWVRKLSYVIDNKSAREKIGMEGRRTVEEKYSLEKNINIIVKILTD